MASQNMAASSSQMSLVPAAKAPYANTSPLIFSSILKDNVINPALSMESIRLRKLLGQGLSKTILNRDLVQTRALQTPTRRCCLLHRTAPLIRPPCELAQPSDTSECWPSAHLSCFETSCLPSRYRSKRTYRGLDGEGMQREAETRTRTQTLS